MLKKIIRTLVGSILLLASAMPLMAEWNFDQKMRVDVPFAFSAKDTTMPAGKYTVSVHPDTGMIMMQAKGQTPLILTAVPKESLNPVSRGRLVFLKSGASMSLIEIWTRGNTTGQTLPLDSKAKEAFQRKQKSKTLVAVSP
jgi:hypothetical protein